MPRDTARRFAVNPRCFDTTETLHTVNTLVLPLLTIPRVRWESRVLIVCLILPVIHIKLTVETGVGTGLAE